MPELDLTVSNNSNTRQLLSDVLSNIKLALRHEIQQRRQLQNELNDMNQIVHKHDYLIREGASKQGPVAALSQHQDMRTVLSEIAVLKEQVFILKMDLANNRHQSQSSTPNNLVLRLSDDVQNLKRANSYTKQLGDGVAPHLGPHLDRNALALRSVMDYISEFQQEFGKMRSRLNQIDEKLVRDPDRSMRQSILEEVRQMISSDQPKLDRVLDSLRINQRTEHDQIAQLSRSQERLLGDVNNRYQITEGQLDQFQKDITNRLLGLESVLRAEIRSRKSANKDIHSEIVHLNEHILQRLHESQSKCWEQVSSIADNLSSLKNVYRSDAERWTKDYHDLSNSTTDSLSCLSMRFQKQQQAEGKAIADLKTDIQDSFLHLERHYSQLFEDQKRSRSEWEADNTKQMQNISKALSSDIKAFSDQISKNKLNIDQVGKHIDAEIRNRIESIEMLRSQAQRFDDDLRKECVSQNESLNIMLMSLSDQANVDRAEFKQSIQNVEKKLSKEIGSQKAQVDSDITTVDHRIRQFIDEKLYLINGTLDQMSNALDEQQKNLEDSSKSLSVQIADVDDKHSKESARLEHYLSNDARMLSQTQNKLATRLVSIESHIQQNSDDLKAEISTQSDSLHMKMKDLSLTFNDNLTQNAINEHVKSVLGSIQDAVQQQSDRSDRDLKQIRLDHEALVSESSSHRLHLNEVVEQEVRMRESCVTQLNETIADLSKTTRSDIDKNRADVDKCCELIRETADLLKDRMRSDHETELAAVTNLSGELMQLNQTIRNEADNRQRDQERLCDQLNILKEQFDAERQHVHQSLQHQSTQCKSDISELSAAMSVSKQALANLETQQHRALDETNQLVLSKIEALSKSIESGANSQSDENRRIHSKVQELNNSSDDHGKRLDAISADLSTINVSVANHQQNQNDLRQAVQEIRTKMEEQSSTLNENLNMSSKALHDQLMEQSYMIDSSVKEVRLQLQEHQQNFSFVAEEIKKITEDSLKLNSETRELFQQELSSIRADISREQERILESDKNLMSFRQQLDSQIKQLNSEGETGRDARSQLHERFSEYQDQNERLISELKGQMQNQITTCDQLRRDLGQTRSLLTQNESTLNQTLQDRMTESSRRTDERIEQVMATMKQNTDEVDKKIVDQDASISNVYHQCQDVQSKTESALKQLSNDLGQKIDQAINDFESDLTGKCEALEILTKGIDRLDVLQKAMQVRSDESIKEMNSKFSKILDINKDNFRSQQQQVEQTLLKHGGEQKEMQSQFSELSKKLSEVQKDSQIIASQIKAIDDGLVQNRSRCSNLQDDLQAVKNSASEQLQAAQTEIAKLTEQGEALNQAVNEVKQTQSSRLMKLDDFSERMERSIADLGSKSEKTEAALADMKSHSSIQFDQMRDEVQMEILSTTNSLSEIRKVTDSYSANLSQLKLDLNTLSTSTSKVSECQEGLKNCTNTIEMIRERSEAQYQESIKTSMNVLEKFREQLNDQERKTEEFRKRDESMMDMKISSIREQIEMEILTMTTTVNSLDKQVKSLLATTITNDKLDAAVQSSRTAIDGSIDSKLRMQSAARKTLEDSINAAQTSLNEVKADIVQIRQRLDQTPRP